MKKNKTFNYDEAFMGVLQGKSKGFHRERYKEKPELRRIIDMLKLKKGKVLDIGCGGGLLTECLPFYYPHARIFGCDVSEKAIHYAKKFGTGRVSYRSMKKKLPYPSNYFDACVCTDVLEHIPDIPFFLKEVKRILKKDGLFFLSIPCEGQPWTFHWFFHKIGFWGDLTYKHIGHIHPEFTHQYVIRLFQRHGFTVLSQKFSERWLVQFSRYAFYMIPKEILEVILGKRKAENYYDHNVVVQDSGRSHDLMMLVRRLWLAFCKQMVVVYTIDAEYFTNVRIGAGKIFLLVRNGKNH